MASAFIRANFDCLALLGVSFDFWDMLKGAGMPDKKALSWPRFVVGLFLSPLLWVIEFYVVPHDELLAGGQLLFYISGIIWLIVVLLLTKAISLALKQKMSATVLMCVSIGLSIPIMLNPASKGPSMPDFQILGIVVPDILILPILSLLTALVFALIAGLRWRTK
ncbi:hypothetical protein Q1W73_10995 [Asticcacaulis sp. ZE23SCel15]|uniref:hypothetical protein n=1 Tax=Asticcacaulis sp. ZE23SCel15 TaxID=3059027 RepID=UPI00265F2E54|nr:hypothetical protein [Asticcacaulis sp. ZE23SCel15]WKL56217.1 hypothetical protein Q1W73_10995 [Asticcacaulis sp. ZE23SCel15]